jgi:hypothetical protein
VETMKTVLTLEFNESLSDSSLKMITGILKDSLGFDTKIISCEEIGD